jgi:large subunit ribosomal protein L10
MKDFSKEHKRLEVKMLSIGGRLLPPSELDTLAKMPTYDQAISMLMAVMKAPVEKLARTMKEVPGKLVRTLAAVKDAKEAA